MKTRINEILRNNSHMRENYTDYIFMIHEYIYRVVPFAFNSHMRDKYINRILMVQKYINYRAAFTFISHLRDFRQQEPTS